MINLDIGIARYFSQLCFFIQCVWPGNGCTGFLWCSGMHTSHISPVLFSGDMQIRFLCWKTVQPPYLENIFLIKASCTIAFFILPYPLGSFGWRQFRRLLKILIQRDSLTGTVNGFSVMQIVSAPTILCAFTLCGELISDRCIHCFSFFL